MRNRPTETDDEADPIRHADCGTILRVRNAVLENGETWCPECKVWFIASPETLEVR